MVALAERALYKFHTQLLAIAMALFAFYSAFNLLEAILPNEQAATVADLKFMKMRPFRIPGVVEQGSLWRVTFTGRRGYELHVPTKDAVALHEFLHAHDHHGNRYPRDSHDPY